MGPVHFKLSMSDGLTRRLSFPNRPSWTELATRIHALCRIPLNRLGVSYVDSDGDEVTLSSEEELRDFYSSNVDNAIQGNQLIRFRVVELGSLRPTDNFMEPTSPPQSSSRNTFGRPTPFVFVDHDHLPFGDLFIPSPLDRDDEHSPHAFVEVVDEDIEKEHEFMSDMDNPAFEDKGKARDLRASISDDVSSSESVLANETPKKPPIHVQVHGLRPMDSGTFGPPASSTPARESVTPTPSRPIPSGDGDREEADRELPGSFPDPPTPELDDPIDPNISLSNDLASLLDSLNSMFLEHPEVGHHLRSLFSNAVNGAYWNADRDSMARVAEDIQRVARDAQSAVATGAQEMAYNIRQRAQQEAARRVTDAVGNILRAFGAGDTGFPPSNANPLDSAQMPPYHQTPPPDPPAAFSPSHAHQPPKYHTSLQPPLPGMTPSSEPGMSPDDIIMPVGSGGAPVWNQFRPFREPSPDPQSAGPSSGATHPPEVSYYTASTYRGPRSTSELKAALESAKANYKAEKERYRREQENRRRERRAAKEAAANSPMSPGAQPVDGHTSDSMAQSDADTSRRPDPSSSAPPPVRQIISNARGRYPQLEMVNFPRSPTKQRGGDKAQRVDTVVERLEGMGFHEASWPTMRTVVEEHVPADEGKFTKEVEDDVMSEILEKLLETSGSGMHTAPSSKQ